MRMQDFVYSQKALSCKGKLFLSYARRDAKELAERLLGDLKKHGYDVWMDTKNISAGREWEQEIKDGLRSTQLVIALLSPRAVRLTVDPQNYDESDSVCLDEISFARFAKPPKPIVPIMVLPCEPPFCIFRLDYVDMCSWTDSEDQYQAGLRRVLEAIDLGLNGKIKYRWWESKLKPWDFAAFLHEKRRDFCGREWLFREIEAWRISGCERALLITGDPGIGKSAFVAQLVHLNPGGQVLAYHCCQADSKATLEPGVFIRSLAAMIASKINEYAVMLSDPILEEALSNDNCTKDPGGSFERGILAPLEKLHAPKSGVRYILVDALDESLLPSGQRTTIVDVIAPRLERMPHWLRIVATTRRDRAVLDNLRGLKAKRLDAQDPRNLEDINQYINNRCSSPALRKLLALSLQSPELVRSILLKKSEGNFLYIQQILQGIERDIYTFEKLDSLPPGLAGLYHAFFTRQFPDKVSYSQVRCVLEVVVAAQEPLTGDLISKATGLDPENELPSTLRRISAYLPEFHDTMGKVKYALYHKSLNDWLTAPNERGGLHYVSQIQGHKALADVCWKEFKANPSQSSHYTGNHLPAHLLALGDWKRLILLLAINREPNLIEEWIESGNELGLTCLTNLINKSDLEPAHKAALATQVARIHSNRGEYSDAKYWLDFALERSSRWHGRRTHAIALHELGSLALYRGNKQHAILYYRKALRLCLWGLPVYHDEAAANEIALASVELTNISSPDFHWSKVVRTANHAYREARSASNSRHAIASQRVLATAFEHLGKYDKAISVCQLALETSDHEKAYVEEARLLSLSGYFSYRQSLLHDKTYDEAKEYFNKAAKKAECIHYLYTQLEATLGLGSCALANGQTEEATRCFERICSALQSQQHYELLTAAYLGLAATIHQKGNLENARSEYQQVISFAEQGGSLGSKTRSLIGLGAVYWHTGYYSKAEETWKEAQRCARHHSVLSQQMTNINIQRCRIAPNIPPL